MSNVRAFTVGRTESGWSRSVTHLSSDDLGDGDVIVRVEYSGINFKDGLSSTENGRVARIDPLVPGIDLALATSSSRESNSPPQHPGGASPSHRDQPNSYKHWAQVDLDTYEDKAARARLYKDRHSPSKAPLD